MKKISAIICVFNEESTIKDVILSVSKSKLINEIIVIDDGSKDKTGQILYDLNREIDFKYIKLPENKGKGYAMVKGVEQAQGDILIFIDADLSNLKETHISKLLNPLIKKEADMVLGQATDTILDYSINPFKSLTGERAIEKNNILPILDKMKHSRFGVETLINLYFQSRGKKIEYVMLSGLKHPTKFSKSNTPQAMTEFIKEGHEIALTVFKNFNLITGIIKKHF